MPPISAVYADYFYFTHLGRRLDRLGQEFLGFQGRHAPHGSGGDRPTEYRVDYITGREYPRNGCLRRPGTNLDVAGPVHVQLTAKQGGCWIMTYEEAVRGQFLRVAGIHVTDPNGGHPLPRLALADNFIDDVVPNDVNIRFGQKAVLQD